MTTKELTMKASEYLIVVLVFNVLLIGLWTIHTWILVQYFDRTVYLAGPSWVVDATKFEPIENKKDR